MIETAEQRQIRVLSERVVLLESQLRVLVSDRNELTAELSRAMQVAADLSAELKRWQERCAAMQRALDDATDRSVPF